MGKSAFWKEYETWGDIFVPLIRWPYFNAKGYQCPDCGRTILEAPGCKKKQSFCSVVHSGNYKSKVLVGKKSPRYKGPKPILNCDYCKEDFERAQCFVGNWATNFCTIEHRFAYFTEHGNSKPNSSKVTLRADAKETMAKIQVLIDEEYCKTDAMRELGLSYGEIKTFLAEMKTSFKGKWKYPRGAANWKWQKRIDVPCTICGVLHPRIPGNILDGPMYCSTHCMGRARWKGGTKCYRGKTWTKQRQAARNRDGDTCKLCGIYKGRAIDVHHIRPYRLFTDSAQANDLSNLVCLCRSCHLKVEGTTDNGNVQTWRREFEQHLARKAAKLESRGRSRRLIFATGQIKPQ